MQVKFYLKESELFFYLRRDPLGDRYGTAVPATEFDNKATEEHVKLYPDAYKEFKKANPEFKLKWAELDFEVAVVKAVEVVEVLPEPAVVEEVIEEVKPKRKFKQSVEE